MRSKDVVKLIQTKIEEKNKELKSISYELQEGYDVEKEVDTLDAVIEELKTLLEEMEMI